MSLIVKMQIIVTIITFTSTRHRRCFTNCIDINLLVAACRHSGIDYHVCVCVCAHSFFNNTVYKNMREKKNQKTRNSVQVSTILISEMIVSLWIFKT